jgi:hypothetical protein
MRPCRHIYTCISSLVADAIVDKTVVLLLFPPLFLSLDTAHGCGQQSLACNASVRDHRKGEEQTGVQDSSISLHPLAILVRLSQNMVQDERGDNEVQSMGAIKVTS